MKGLPSNVRYLELGDYLVIAEAVTGTDARVLARMPGAAERNGRTWTWASPAETDRVIRGVAAGEVSQQDLVEWVRDRHRRRRPDWVHKVPRLRV